MARITVHKMAQPLGVEVARLPTEVRFLTRINSRSFLNCEESRRYFLDRVQRRTPFCAALLCSVLGQTSALNEFVFFGCPHLLKLMLNRVEMSGFDSSIGSNLTNVRKTTNIYIIVDNAILPTSSEGWRNHFQPYFEGFMGFLKIVENERDPLIGGSMPQEKTPENINFRNVKFLGDEFPRLQIRKVL